MYIRSYIITNLVCCLPSQLRHKAPATRTPLSCQGTPVFLARLRDMARATERLQVVGVPGIAAFVERLENVVAFEPHPPGLPHSTQRPAASRSSRRRSMRTSGPSRRAFRLGRGVGPRKLHSNPGGGQFKPYYASIDQITAVRCCASRRTVISSETSYPPGLRLPSQAVGSRRRVFST